MASFVIEELEELLDETCVVLNSCQDDEFSHLNTVSEKVSTVHLTLSEREDRIKKNIEGMKLWQASHKWSRIGHQYKQPSNQTTLQGYKGCLIYRFDYMIVGQ